MVGSKDLLGGAVGTDGLVGKMARGQDVLEGTLLDVHGIDTPGRTELLEPLGAGVDHVHVASLDGAGAGAQITVVRAVDEGSALLGLGGDVGTRVGDDSHEGGRQQGNGGQVAGHC